MNMNKRIENKPKTVSKWKLRISENKKIVILLLVDVLLLADILLSPAYERHVWGPLEALIDHAPEYITPYDPLVADVVWNLTRGVKNDSLQPLLRMYAWVRSNIKYVSDKVEYWQFPNETLTLRQGDCEDQAFLIASMIKNYYGDECVVGGLIIFPEGQMEGHVAAFMFSDEGFRVVDPAGAYLSPTSDLEREIGVWVKNWDSGRIHYVFTETTVFKATSTREAVEFLEALQPN